MKQWFFTVMAVLAALVSVPVAARSGGSGGGLGFIQKVVRSFSDVDTNYIEPQHYNFTVMTQGTVNYDMFRLKSHSGQSVTFAPDIIMKVGPYIGWRWFFLGYTFDLKNLSFGSNSKKQEIEFSVYSSKIGVDLFYRRTGSDYKIRSVYMGNGAETGALDGKPFDGVNVGVTGVNLYYIFNHKRFSYPAAFAQSTCQKRSCGSWMAGVGYTHNSISLDYEKLKNVVAENTVPGTALPDSGFNFSGVEFQNVNVSCGYAYNWVFAKNWLACASGSVALAYKHSKGEAEGGGLYGFKLDNVNVDGIGRFAVVYNNTRWYAGASAILHTNNYRKDRFATSNVYGSINVYMGYNFGLKSKYKKKK